MKFFINMRASTIRSTPITKWWMTMLLILAKQIKTEALKLPLKEQMITKEHLKSNQNWSKLTMIGTS